MKCEQIMTSDPVCCASTDSATEAARAMQLNDIGLVPVVDGRGRMVGVITDRDIALQVVARGLDPAATRLDAIMTTPPFSCAPDDTIDTATALMSTRQIRRMPIVRDGEVLGIVSQADIATRLVQPSTTAEVVRAISEPSRG